MHTSVCCAVQIIPLKSVLILILRSFALDGETLLSKIDFKPIKSESLWKAGLAINRLFILNILKRFAAYDFNNYCISQADARIN